MLYRDAPDVVITSNECAERKSESHCYLMVALALTLTEVGFREKMDALTKVHDDLRARYS
jgi:hypothetical protein